MRSHSSLIAQVLIATLALFAGAGSFAWPKPPDPVQWSPDDCSAFLSRSDIYPNAVTAGKSGYILTNTPAFRAYALRTALEQFAWINRALHLGGPDPVSCADVTRFTAYPNYYGLHCSVVIGNRFAVSISRNRVASFSDLDYSLTAFESRPQRLDELLSKPNKLDKKAAKALARRALAALGLTNRTELPLREPPYVRQWETDTGPMPFFDVFWKDAGFNGPLEAIYGDAVSLEICGVNANVAHFHLSALPPQNPTLRLPYATNFFEMLGMSPTNRFWTWTYRNE